MSTACRMRPATTKPTQQQGSIDGSINRFRGGRARRRARRVSRLLPVPPHELEDVANSSGGDGTSGRQPAPLPGHPLPTTGLGGREVAFERRSDGGGSWVGEEGGADPAVDGEGQGVVRVLGSVSVSDEGAS